MGESSGCPGADPVDANMNYCPLLRETVRHHAMNPAGLTKNYVRILFPLLLLLKCSPVVIFASPGYYRSMFSSLFFSLGEINMPLDFFGGGGLAPFFVTS